jgi:hypothetical protein
MTPVDKPFTVKIRATPGVMSTNERLLKDLEQIRRVAFVLEKEAGDSRGSGVIEEKYTAALDGLDASRASMSAAEYAEALSVVVSLLSRFVDSNLERKRF